MMQMPDPSSESAQERLDNANPKLHETAGKRDVSEQDWEDSIPDPVDEREIFDLVRCINDPEHPLTLEQLDVIRLHDIAVDDQRNRVKVAFTPTIPHCSMATIIGLSIKVKLLRSLSPRFKIDVTIAPGTHSSEAAVNKQLADKVNKKLIIGIAYHYHNLLLFFFQERVAAALENAHLIDVVNQCLAEEEE